MFDTEVAILQEKLVKLGNYEIQQNDEVVAVNRSFHSI